MSLTPDRPVVSAGFWRGMAWAGVISVVGWLLVLLAVMATYGALP